MKTSKRNKGIKEVYHFKPFDKSFPLIAFCLKLGLMYPNPTSDRHRLFLICVVMLVLSPVVYMMLYDMWMNLMQKNIFEMLRHTTIVGPLLGVFLKKFLCFYYRQPTKELLDEVNRDYESYNHLPIRYQVLAASSIRSNRNIYERLWTFAIFVVVVIFWGLALVTTLYSYLFDEVPRRYMIHDVDIPVKGHDARLQTPYYELVFLFMSFCTVEMSINFSAYDGLFGVFVNHSCLKMNLYCMRLEDAFKLKDQEEMDREIKKFLDEQSRCFRFNKLIQGTYREWMGIICIATMIQVGSLLFNFSAGNGIDVRYGAFSASCIVHTFLPCRCAANMRHTSLETATMIYSSGWERSASTRAKRTVALMIARAQQPERLEAFSIFAVDMELFVGIMRTSYTMFTLLQSS